MNYKSFSWHPKIGVLQFKGLTYGHMRWVYKSRLRVLFFRSNLMAEFTSQIYKMCFRIEIAVRD